MPQEEEKKVILVVDDDNASSFICRKYLEGRFDVLAATTGKEAMRMLRSHHVDIILLDIEMPLMDGFDTYDEIRKTVTGVQIPIIFVTGKADMKTVLKCKSKGAEGYIVKPVRREVLVEKLDEIMGQKQLASQRKKVLVVDDSVEYLKTVKQYLKDVYDVMAINTSRTAIEYLRIHEPDVILLDYYMPLYNGADMLRIIRNDSFAPNAKILLISGSMSVDILDECCSLGVDGALAKTATRTELLERLEAILNEK